MGKVKDDTRQFEDSTTGKVKDDPADAFTSFFTPFSVLFYSSLRFSSRNVYKSILWINVWRKNINFRSNLIAKIDSAVRVLFVAPGKLSKT